ncbi:hypothetical protein [Actinomadura sp. WMMA1423]|uniref:hypothetical protein n=1 Tax=Actinomadura sp. WMMA1423 TaxID=2591108 RepID=UPI00143D7476|nr:hypothetical protein [Actinomadura sp. WMMA1423]
MIIQAPSQAEADGLETDQDDAEPMPPAARPRPVARLAQAPPRYRRKPFTASDPEPTIVRKKTRFAVRRQQDVDDRGPVPAGRRSRTRARLTLARPLAVVEVTAEEGTDISAGDGGVKLGE